MGKATGKTGKAKPSVDESDLGALKSEYMALARSALDRAKALLAAGEDDALVYAALELRRALEALVYENALRFTDELIGEDYAVWQPTQLLERLLEIDPVADAALEMRMQDPTTGQWHSLGTQGRIGLKALKKRYYALGNHLHTPSLAQMMRRKSQRHTSLFKLCYECVELVEKDLNATLRLGRMAIFGTFDIQCHECGTPIRQLLNALRTERNKAPGTKVAIRAKCRNCPGSYTIKAGEGDTLKFREDRWMGNCPFPDCNGVHVKWQREMKDGTESVCPSCGEKSVFTQAFILLSEGVRKAMKSKVC